MTRSAGSADDDTAAVLVPFDEYEALKESFAKSSTGLFPMPS